MRCRPNPAQPDLFAVGPDYAQDESGNLRPQARRSAGEVLEEPLVRSEDPATSKTAATSAGALRARHFAVILEALRSAPAGLTAEEIARATDLDPVQVNRRLAGMRRACLIIRTDQVRRTSSGRPSAVHRMVAP